MKHQTTRQPKLTQFLLAAACAGLLTACGGGGGGSAGGGSGSGNVANNPTTPPTFPPTTSFPPTDPPNPPRVTDTNPPTDPTNPGSLGRSVDLPIAALSAPPEEKPLKPSHWPVPFDPNDPPAGMDDWPQDYNPHDWMGRLSTNEDPWCKRPTNLPSRWCPRPTDWPAEFDPDNPGTDANQWPSGYNPISWFNDYDNDLVNAWCQSDNPPLWLRCQPQTPPPPAGNPDPDTTPSTDPANPITDPDTDSEPSAPTIATPIVEDDNIVFPVAFTTPTTNPQDPDDFDARKQAFENNLEYRPRYRHARRNGVPVRFPQQRTSEHLKMINASAAYARGATGEGQVMSMMDFGLFPLHTEFDPAFGPDGGEWEDRKVIAQDWQRDYSFSSRQARHGTMVAAIAVGSKNRGRNAKIPTDRGSHGVAFDAKVYSLAFNRPQTDGYRPFDLAGATDKELADLANFLSPMFVPTERSGLSDIDAKGDVVNFSFGLQGGLTRYDRNVVRDRMAPIAKVLEQDGVAPADKKIVVWMAGNGKRQSDYADSPELLAGLGAVFPELREHVIAVVALDQDGDIADYSNRCGVARVFCVAAPGSDIYTADVGSRDYFLREPGEPTQRVKVYDKYGLAHGTDFAAPVVSGALLVLKDYFGDQLGNDEIVKRLLATANRDGKYADSQTYGHGLIDLDAATRPAGQLMTGLSTDPDARPLSGGIALSGGGLGNSLARAFDGIDIAGFDQLDAPFYVQAGKQLEPAAREIDTAKKLAGDDGIAAKLRGAAVFDTFGFAENDAWHDAWQSARLSFDVHDDGEIADARLGFANGFWLSHGWHGGRASTDFLGLRGADIAPVGISGDDHAFVAPYLSLVRDGPGIGWSNAASGLGGLSGDLSFALMHGTPQFDGWENPGGERGLGAQIDWRVLGARHGSNLAFQAGAVHESDAMLGARTESAFGDAQAMTTFVGVNGVWKPRRQNWTWQAAAYFGRTDAQIDDGFLRADDDIFSNAFSAGGVRNSLWKRNDRFDFVISQPMQVNSGDAELRIPIGRTRYGEVIHGDYAVDLSPAERNVKLNARYRLPIKGGTLQTALEIDRHPQYDSEADTATAIGVSFERQF